MKPSVWRYGLAVVLLLLAAFGFGVAYQSMRPPRPDVAQVVVPGETPLTLEADIYLVFYESPSVVDGRRFSTGDLPGLDIEVRSSGGAVVETDPAREVAYQIDGRSGRSVVEFWIEEAGEYTLSASYPQGEGPDVVLAVGVDPGGPQVAAFAGGLGLLPLVGAGLLIRSARSRQRAGRQPKSFEKFDSLMPPQPRIEGPFTKGNLPPMQTSRRKWLPLELMEKAGEAFSPTSIEVTTDREVYWPGETVRAGVDITVEKACEVQEGSISLLMIYGHEDADDIYRESSETVAKRPILQGRQLSTGERIKEDFEAAVPAGASPSAVGLGVQVGWEVGVRLKISGGADSRGGLPITVLSTPEEALPDPQSEGGRFDGYELRLDVQRSTVRIGGVLEGKLTVVPQSTLKVKAIVVSLVYREKVSTGSYRSWSFPKSIDLTLGGKPDLTIGVPNPFPFSLPIPDSAFPSMKSPIFENSWTLTAKVDRSFRKDEAVEIPIQILTGLPE